MAFEVLTHESQGDWLTYINAEGLEGLKKLSSTFSSEKYGLTVAEVPKGEAWCVLVSEAEVLALKIRTPASPDFWTEAIVKDL